MTINSALRTITGWLKPTPKFFINWKQAKTTFFLELKFLLETKLKPESFKTLDGLLMFWVQKLRPKNNKIINPIIG